jgi:hypothetical protein
VQVNALLSVSGAGGSLPPMRPSVIYTSHCPEMWTGVKCTKLHCRRVVLVARRASIARELGNKLREGCTSALCVTEAHNMDAAPAPFAGWQTATATTSIKTQKGT